MKIEQSHALPDGTVLLREELVLLERLRFGHRDAAIIRGTFGGSANLALRRSSELRRKLGCGPNEGIRDAAERLGVPRFDLY